MRSTILLLEDDLSLIDGLVYMLEREGYQVQVARTIKEAREALKGEIPYALLILDITLPDGTGFMVCEEVRRSGSQVPILFLTASDEELQIIRGLDSGGDDYLTKPFRFGELCSRIRALLRRSSYTTTNQEASSYRKSCLKETTTSFTDSDGISPTLSFGSKQRKNLDKRNPFKPFVGPKREFCR